MKKLCVALLLVGAGCSAPGTTEINRPPGDTAHKRQLTLRTTFSANFFEPFADAAYRNDTAEGFGPGILITCDTFIIVDTRGGISEHDTGRFIPFSSSSYIWRYEGPDTTFELDMEAHTPPGITSPSFDTFVRRGDFFTILYQPSGPCTALQVIFTDNAQDTILPQTQFNSTTGELALIQVPSGLQQGFGTFSIAKLNRSTISTGPIHTVIVEDSTIGNPVGITWQ